MRKLEFLNKLRRMKQSAFAAIGLLLSSLVVGCQNSSAPAVQSEVKTNNTIVLVHGAWAGGWQWKKVGNYLQADGNTVFRPTMTGLGERVHLMSDSVDLNTHITDIVNVIEFEDLHDVILVGHSYGGMVITGVADRIPQRIKRLVYVDAALPEDGECIRDVVPRKNALPPTTNGVILPYGGWPVKAGKHLPYDVPQPVKAFDQKISLYNPARQKVPAVYILTVDPGKKPEDDAFYKSYARAQKLGWPAWTMSADHVVNVTHPKELADLIEKAAALNPQSQD